MRAAAAAADVTGDLYALQRWRDPLAAARCVLLLRASCDMAHFSRSTAAGASGADGAGQLTRRTVGLLVQAAEALQQQVGGARAAACELL